MMLVDTHVLVWAVENNPRLGVQARLEVDAALASDTLTISAISFSEIAMLVYKGRLEVDEALDPWRQKLLDAGLVEIPVSGGIGIRAIDLHGLHSDPADRIIVATARELGATLLTADRRLLDWHGSLRRLDAVK